MADDRRHHLKLLGALDALLSERHVTRAAARLHLSQSATSGILAQLREVFNDPLLVRVGRELALTARAQQMLPQVRDALAGVDTLFGTQRAFAPAVLVRQFKLAVSDAVGQLLLPALVQNLAQAAPGVRLKVSAVGAEAPDKLLASGALDMAIGHFEDLPLDLRATTLYDHSLVAAVRTAHPTIRGRLTQRQLLATPQVAIFPHSAALESAFRDLFTRHGQAFKLAASVQQLSVALAMVEKTDAVALVTEPMARLYAKAFAIQVLTLPRTLQLPRVRVQAIWHERTHHDPACVWLREALHAVSRRVPQVKTAAAR